jgi:hypothetical protein
MEMKITIEVPEKTSCAFLNYVFGTSSGMTMGIKQIGTEDIHSGKVIVCDACEEAEMESDGK